jgi:cell division protein FtsB
MTKRRSRGPQGSTRAKADEGSVSARRFRSGRVVRLLLLGATVALAAVLATSSVRTWIDQREQLDEARREASELDARIESLQAEIATRTSEDGARIDALCFGPYVEPGVEVYSIPGVDGCVSAD